MIELTNEEQQLFNKLKDAPKCMHNPKYMSETDTHWKCEKCGLLAKKSIEIFPGVFVNEA